MRNLTDTRIDRELCSRGLYLRLCGLTWCSLAIVAVLVLWLLKPGLLSIHPWAWLVTVGIVGIATTILGILYLLTIYAVYSSAHLPMGLLRAACSTVYKMLPYALWWGHVFHIPKEKVGQSLVDVINSVSAKYILAVQAEDIMLLTPHCLQLDSCPIKVTRDAFSCRECGRCSVGGLVALAKHYGVQLYIATGGTFARLLVKKHRPKVIIAIACERDLVLGTRDVFPILVFGVLNRRPYGPCFNTQVDLAKVEEVLQRLLPGERKLYECENGSSTKLALYSLSRRICQYHGATNLCP